MRECGIAEIGGMRECWIAELRECGNAGMRECGIAGMLDCGIAEIGGMYATRIPKHIWS